MISKLSLNAWKWKEMEQNHFLKIFLNSIPLRYYDQDLALARDLEDRASMGRAYCNLGLAHIALGNLENALECQKYFLGEIYLI